LRGSEKEKSSVKRKEETNPLKQKTKSVFETIAPSFFFFFSETNIAFSNLLAASGITYTSVGVPSIASAVDFRFAKTLAKMASQATDTFTNLKKK